MTKAILQQRRVLKRLHLHEEKGGRPKEQLSNIT